MSFRLLWSKGYPWPSAWLGRLTWGAIVAYLAAYMIWGGVVAAQLCERGVPLTPEHEAHHMLAKQLGMEESLNHTLAPDAKGTPTTSYSILMLLTGEPIVRSAQNTSSLLLSAPYYYANESITGILDELIVVSSLALTDMHLPNMPTLKSPDPPPRY